MAVTGLITDIKKFAIHDGPGIRTTVFLKGCPLRCLWCHNPETQSPQSDVAYISAHCIGCAKCIRACPSDALSQTENGIVRDYLKCTACGACAEACPTEAMTVYGRKVSVEEAIAEVEKDRPFYETSGGGMTISGGEPLYQADFAVALMKVARNTGLHTCLDTCGLVPWAAFQAILPYTDTVLYDVKTLDNKRHREATGCENHVIIANLAALVQAGAEVLVRTPVIPGLNATPEAIADIADFLAGLTRPPELELLPYHELGEAKFERLGMEYKLRGVKPPDKTLMANLVQIAEDHGVTCKIGN